MEQTKPNSEFTSVKTPKRPSRRREQRRRAPGGKRRFVFPAVSRRFARNTFICAVLLLAVVGLKSIDSDIARDFISGVSSAANGETHIDAEVGRLIFVSAEEPSVSVPLDGEVVSAFSETGGSVRMKGEENADVTAMISGEVTASTSSSVTILQTNGVVTSYFGLRPLVGAGSKVKSGDCIGVLSGEVLTLSSSGAEGSVDPLSVLTTKKNGSGNA